MSSDPIHPTHYTGLTPEPITVINGWNLDFLLGNIVKYLARSTQRRRKATALTDLKKAEYYLARKIKELEDA